MNSAPLRGIEACVFDAYGTLFDFAAAARDCKDELGDHADRLTALWREKQVQYTWLRAARGRHADFWQVTGDALDFSLETLGLEHPALRERLMGLHLMREAFPEVPGVLRHRKTAGLRTAILSNGSPKNARRGRQRRQAGSIVRCRSFRRGSRGLSAAPKGLSTCRRPAWRFRARYWVPVVECLGHPRGVGVPDARHMVQSIWTACREIARRSRPRNPIVGGITGAGRRRVSGAPSAGKKCAKYAAPVVR
jgi:HAD superfamily hydrolase (TIGR01493 family)